MSFSSSPPSPDEAHNLNFYYAQAEDYPVDLYYLMDLSKSMEDDKEKLSALGDLLAESMRVSRKEIQNPPLPPPTSVGT